MTLHYLLCQDRLHLRGERKISQRQCMHRKVAPTCLQHRKRLLHLLCQEHFQGPQRGGFRHLALHGSFKMDCNEALQLHIPWSNLQKCEYGIHAISLALVL